MWLLITLLMTSSMHEIAESSKGKYFPWQNNVIKPIKEVKEFDCLAEGSNGNEYRGTVSVTSGGHRCLQWDRIQHIGFADSSHGLGSHNFCRNPDNRSGPWCWIRGYDRKVREFCTIPKCDTKPDIPTQDTEMTCGERTPKQTSQIYKIIGGSKASIESQPWLAAIFKNNVFRCGGTLIAPCWIITATHCFPSGKRTRKEQYSVYLGKDATNQTDLSKEQKFEVTKIVLHQKFNFDLDDFNHDIALLQIADSKGQCARKTESVRTACLPPAHHMPPYGSFCHIAGYGHEKNDKIPDTFRYSLNMKQAQVQIISPTVCERKDYYGNRVTENQFCAASPKWTEDACQGDSGGPLLCEDGGRMFLFGIISWGEKCALESKPGVYTKVTNYNKWIEKHTGLNRIAQGIMYPQKD
ncbi:urokinase-type plasminogen activator precursor [Silurus asotus]|uniref:trypsin n=1 Tax=Silurus asotus TaxID=30991 RepID=A0AAD5B0V4_SILAS|nr:urokinase-type plasminogen activator precursor [Silurus asotus]